MSVKSLDNNKTLQICDRDIKDFVRSNVCSATQRKNLGIERVRMKAWWKRQRSKGKGCANGTFVKCMLRVKDGSILSIDPVVSWNVVMIA